MRSLTASRFITPLLATAVVAVAAPVPAPAKTSHEGWPRIDGVLRMHKADESAEIRGTGRSDELLGGHGNDVLRGGGSADVLWGDYKPCCQPTSQVDVLVGGSGNDFIYASHGRNDISAGSGRDVVHAHFGRGVVDCGPGRDVVYFSHKRRAGWKARNCERISFKTLGY
jgi:hypothetical protein